jgi:GGDEF domain-containing protein
MMSAQVLMVPRMSYTVVRRFLLAAGLIGLARIAGLGYARGVDRLEVTATILFIPVFVALFLWGIKGGVVAGILAAVAYATLRYPAIQVVGLTRFVGLILSRTVAYLAFGAIGGWATSQLESSLDKLELYDQVDDETKLNNARFFLENTDMEMSRSRRYQTIFSVAMVDVPRSALDSLSSRQQRSVLRDLGGLLDASVRNVDSAVHARDDLHHRFAVILPETGGEGARTFTQRLAQKLGEQVRRRSVPLEGDLAYSAITFPGDETSFDRVRAEFQEIDRIEHPEASLLREPGPAEGEEQEH